MPPLVRPSSLAGKKVMVVGLGRFGGGVGVSRWLTGQGAKVTVNDEQPAEKLAESLHQLDGLPIEFKLGGHRLDDFLAADLLVINPAVDKQKSPAVREALAKGIPCTTEMNLFLERNSAFTIGITGSVGKSTTTSLIFEALRAGLGSRSPVPSSQPATSAPPTGNRELTTGNPSPPTVHLGGNIGKSLLLDLPGIRSSDFVVLELSSFMLEDTPAIQWSPNIAVITNLFPNHLDRHDTLSAYAAAKQNILKFQTASDTAIFNRDDPAVSQWFSLAKGKIADYTTRGVAALPLAIPGEHNQSNAQAALAVLEALEARGIALDRAAALRAIGEFAGLSHRLQLVHTLMLPPGDRGEPARALRFYNDSKATTPEASITALNAFPPRSAIFLVGGYDKHADMSSFEELLAQRAGGVIGLGQTGRAIIDRVGQRSRGLSQDRVAYAGTLEGGVPLAHRWACASGSLTAVVLSPGSASWGQFPNYEKRGETFVVLCRGLRSAMVSPPAPP